MFAASKSIHWPNLRYFVEWKRFIADIPREQINQIRRSIKTRFNELIWVPAPARDRLWTYKDDNRYEGLPRGAKSGPHVLINPTYYAKPIFDPPAIRLEEEEGSDDLNPGTLHEQLFGSDDDLYSSDDGALASDADLFTEDDGALASDADLFSGDDGGNIEEGRDGSDREQRDDAHDDDWDSMFLNVE